MPSLSCEPLLPNDSDALPRYRHAAPSGPWPWMDFSHADVTTASTAITTVATVATAVTNASIATEWSGYPQNRFGNWTTTQVERSQMFAKCSTNKPSKIYWMDVGDDGKFTTPDVTGGGHTGTVTTAYQGTFWDILQGEVNLTCHLWS
jgi:spore germination protein GerM